MVPNHPPFLIFRRPRMSRLLFSAVLGFGLATSGAALAQSSTSTSVDSGINASGTTKQQSPDSSTKPDNSAVNGTQASDASGNANMTSNNPKGTANGPASAAMGSGAGGGSAGGGGAAGGSAGGSAAK